MTSGGTELPIYEEWKEIARKDWQRIHRNLQEDDAEAAGYFLQQSLEKYLKAFLIQRGWKLRKIHVLHELLNEAAAYHAPLESFRPLCERVSGYYLLERYPPLEPSGLTCEEIDNDMEQARHLVLAMFPGEPLE